MTKVSPAKPSGGDARSTPFSSPAQPTPSAEPARPKFIVTLGRGSRGKTWWIRWAAERAQQQGRDVVVADADRTNATLSAYFAAVLTPPSADDADMRDWLAQLCEQQIETGFTVLLDLGGGDLLLKQVAREIGLVGFLEANGVRPVAVHLIGPDRDDLAYLRDLEQDGLFAPEATLLVLNEALVPTGRSVSAAFQSVIDNPIFRAAVARGAKPVWMPRLAPAHGGSRPVTSQEAVRRCICRTTRTGTALGGRRSGCLRRGGTASADPVPNPACLPVRTAALPSWGHRTNGRRQKGSLPVCTLAGAHPSGLG